MKILIICVNYNSYHHLLSYARSLSLAHKRAVGVEFKFVVVDNSTISPNRSVLGEIRSIIDDFVYLKSNNIGYFPAASLAVDSIMEDVKSYDYVAVSNVDLEMTQDFFVVLSKYTINKNDGILAPSVISRFRRSDLNPKIITRPSCHKIKKNIKIFKIPFLFWLHCKLSDLKFRLSNACSFGPRLIYAPHGSFILFTNRFFCLGGNLQYPRFLFGEEIFVAEECALRNLHVRYFPDLVINDLDHGSTSLKSVRFISTEHVKSLNYLLGRYFS